MRRGSLGHRPAGQPIVASAAAGEGRPPTAVLAGKLCRMKLPKRRVTRVLFPAISLVLLVLTAPAPVPATPPSPAAGEQPTAKNETRLRKLHLVRPDLIPYPIAFEVYC